MERGPEGNANSDERGRGFDGLLGGQAPCALLNLDEKVIDFPGQPAGICSLARGLV